MGSQYRIPAASSGSNVIPLNKNTYLKDFFQDETQVTNEDEYDEFIDTLSIDEESILDQFGLSEQWDDLMQDSGFLIF